MTKEIRIGSEFRLRVDLCCLYRTTGEEVHLRPQAFQALLYLLRHRDRLVTKDELTTAIWGDVAVTDNALLQCIVELRRALDDDARRPRYLRTVTKLGYRFIGDVEEAGEEAAAPATPPPDRSLVAPPAVAIDAVSPGEGELPPHADLRTSLPNALRRRWPAMVAAACLVAVAAFAAAGIGQGLRSDHATTPDPGRAAVAVMYLDNQSHAADLEWMRKGLADMLITGLSRSKRLNVISREQMDMLLSRIGHDPSQPVSLEQAIDIARRSQASYFVLGGFARLGTSFRIDLRLYDATGQFKAAEELAVADAHKVLTDVDSLSWKLAGHLGEGVREPIERLAAGLTTNLDAFRFYSLGVERARAYQIDEAVGLFERALELDPNFVMARARIGFGHLTNSDPSRAKPFLEDAMRAVGRLTETDRLHLQAWRATADGVYAEAIAAYRQLLARSPGDLEAYARLANLLIGEKRYDEAIDVLQRGLAIDPENGDLHNFLARAYIPLGRYDDSIRERQAYVELAPDEPLAHDTLGLSYQVAGRYEEAVAAYQRALDLQPDFEPAVIHLANAYFQMGQYRAAAERYQRYTAVAPDALKSRGRNSLTLLHLRRGELETADRVARQLQAEVAPGYSVAYIEVALQRGVPAESLARLLPTGNPHQNRGRRSTERFLHCARGRLALATGDVDRALDYMRRAMQEEPIIWEADSYEDCLAKGLLDMKRYDDAIAEYLRVLKINPRYPLAHYHLALAYERSGRAAQARSVFADFLRVWQMADPDVPEIVAAKRRLSALSN